MTLFDIAAVACFLAMACARLLPPRDQIYCVALVARYTSDIAYLGTHILYPLELR
jgi:hypothetical protein